MALPYSRRSSALTSFLFPFVSMVSFDFVTNEVGLWTAVTAITYGMIGLVFHFYLKNKEKVGIKNYLMCGVVGILVFDFVTGVLATPLLYGGTFTESFIGQIPFTLVHLLTGCLFILIVTPILDRGVLLNKELDDHRAWFVISHLSID
jgi:uncharacterized membrane protein